MTFLDYTLRLVRFGFAMWVAVLGRRRATKLVIGGAIASTILAVVLQVTT